VRKNQRDRELRLQYCSRRGLLLEGGLNDGQKKRLCLRLRLQRIITIQAFESHHQSEIQPIRGVDGFVFGGFEAQSHGSSGERIGLGVHEGHRSVEGEFFQTENIERVVVVLSRVVVLSMVIGFHSSCPSDYEISRIQKFQCLEYKGHCRRWCVMIRVVDGKSPQPN